MRGIVVALIALAVLGVPLAVASTAAAGTDMSAQATRNLTPVIVGPLPTDRFGGGMWVGVKAGDANFGVLYGDSANPNNLIIFAEYTRYIGGAEVVNEQGTHLATRGIPVYTVLAQSLNRFIEFRTVNASDGFDLFSAGGTPVMIPVNVPVKAVDLRTGTWNLTDLTDQAVGGTTYVNFTIKASDLHYTWVNLRMPGAIGSGDGVLDQVAFTFHLSVNVVTKTADIPWYKVTVSDGTAREVTNVSYLGNRTVSGPAAVMGAKYDHLIQGWDFANKTDRLALETHILFGNFYPDATVDFVHKAYAQERADDGSSTIIDNRSAATIVQLPHLYTRDQIYFDDSWTRIGAFRWTSDVTVDGQPAHMLFQIQGGGRLFVIHGGAAFAGFWIRGAYVYPSGQTIVHDPAMNVESFAPNVTSSFNLTPLDILLIQVAVVGVAIIPALYLRNKARRSKNQ